MKIKEVFGKKHGTVETLQAAQAYLGIAIFLFVLGLPLLPVAPILDAFAAIAFALGIAMIITIVLAPLGIVLW